MLRFNVVPRKLSPRPFSDLSHIPILFHRAVRIIGIFSFVATPEAHHCETADDECSSAKDNEEDDERRG